MGWHACANCPALSTSPVASSALTQCTCTSGNIPAPITCTTTTQALCQDDLSWRDSAGDGCDTYASSHPSGNNLYCDDDSWRSGNACYKCCASCRNQCEPLGGSAGAVYGETCSQYCRNLGPVTEVTTCTTFEVQGCVALCPAFSSAPQGSTLVSQCTCVPGYTGLNGGSCTDCVAGKYKAASGSAACDLCSAGKFSAATGQSTSATCQNCPAGQYSVAGATVCTNCAANSYASLTGSSTCSTCPALSSSPPGSSAVTQCTCNAGSSGPAGGPCTINDCVAGTTGPPGSCTACVAGTYKDTAGAQTCTK